MTVADVGTAKAAQLVAGMHVQRHGLSTIANETVFEPPGLDRELSSLVQQKAEMTLLWSEVLGSFPAGLAPPAGIEAAVPADPGGGERLGCES